MVPKWKIWRWAPRLMSTLISGAGMAVLVGTGIWMEHNGAPLWLRVSVGTLILSAGFWLSARLFRDLDSMIKLESTNDTLKFATKALRAAIAKGHLETAEELADWCEQLSKQYKTLWTTLFIGKTRSRS